MKKTETGWTCGFYGGQRAASSILVGRTVGRKPLGKPSHRWEDYIKMYFQEVRLRVLGWVGVVQE